MVFKLETFEVVEVVGSIKSGMTQPYLCRLADDRLYAVKGRAALNRGLISEVVSGWLGQSLGVPIPFFALADLPVPLLNCYEDRELSRSLGSGTLFASLWYEPVEAMVMPMLGRMPSEILAMIYAFDHWIMNGDRTLSEHGGNPNLLIGLDNNSLIAIDHNLAFSDTYNPSELKLHACRDAWLRKSTEGRFCDHIRAEMIGLIARIDEVFSQIPDQWLEEEADFLNVIRSNLVRVNQPAFWEELV